MPNNTTGQPSGNPWLSIWTSPRATIAEIVRTNPSYCFLLLCFIYGFASALSSAQRISLGLTTSPWVILAVSAVLGFLLGFVSLTVFSFLVSWTGKWCGGKGSYKEVRAVVAWSNVPVVVDLLLWALLLAIYGGLVFTQDFAQVVYFQSAEGSMLLFPEPRLLVVFGIVRVIVSIWSIVIFLAGLREVQGFSLFKAILNALLSMFVVIVAVFLMFMTVWGIQGFVQK